MPGLRVFQVRIKYSSRFFLYAPLCLFLALAVWVMAYWWAAAGALDKKLTALNGHDAAAGITLSYAGKTISGFPFNLDVAFTGLKIQGRGAHGPFAWSSEHMVLHRLTYGRDQDIYEAAGRQTFSWTDGAGQGHAIAFLPGTLRASSITDARGLARFDIDVVAADGTGFTAAGLQFHLRRDPDRKTLDVMLAADDVKGQTPFGGGIAQLRLYAGLNDIRALAGLLAGTQAWPDAAAAWRAAGGGAHIDKVDIRSPGLTTTAPGDPRLQALLSPLY